VGESYEQEREIEREGEEGVVSKREGGRERKLARGEGCVSNRGSTREVRVIMVK